MKKWDRTWRSMSRGKEFSEQVTWREGFTGIQEGV